MPAKIGVLFLQSQGYFGADSQIHSLLMKHLDRERYSVHVACNPGTRSDPSPAWQALSEIDGISLLPTNFGPSVFAATRINQLRAVLGSGKAVVDFPRLLLYIRRHNIRIIHGTEKPRDVLWNLALSRLTGAKSIVHLHVKCHDRLTSRARVGLSKANAVMCISDFVADSVVEAGYEKRRVFVVKNGLDVDDWEPALDGNIRTEFEIAPSQPIVLVASRLFAWKGHRDLVRAFAIAHREAESPVLMVVGADDPRAHPGGGSFRAELEATVAELGIAGSVIFTGFRSDIRELMAACDIFAMPSFEEPFGMVYLEAMAMERPVVALDNGGAKEVIDNGGSGLLSAPGDVDALAGNLVTLLRSPSLRQRMGEHGRRRVKERFSAEGMARNAEGVYEQLLVSQLATVKKVELT